MSEILQEPAKIVYDPGKPYTWKPEDTFTLQGGEFGLVFNTLVKKEGELLRDLEIINILKNKLKESVEAGIATEKSAAPQPK